MATYIQGQTDYISQIQPTEPNLAFDAQVLQTKQTKYDANHKKINDLYGSLLNSSMSRTDNIQARDEFFKIINEDIKKMGGLDYSLDQNVQAAASVFQSIYTNNNIVKDMVWTKNFNDEEVRGESFKNCIDEEKCGGTYWEEGDRYMQYKKNEFKKASASEALGMGNVRYIPNRNVMKASIKIAKDAGLSVELDKVTGNYIVTTKNGDLIRTPLTTLFSETLGKDPSYADMFKAKAYVNRNDWASNKVKLGEYGDMNEANLAYLQNIDKQNVKKIDDTLEAISLDVDHLTQKVADYAIEFKAGKFLQGSDKFKDYEQLVNLQNSAIQAKKYTNQIKEISEQKNNKMAIQIMADRIDDQNAFTYFNEEINDAVNTLAYQDAKQKMSVDDIAKMKIEHGYKTAELALKQSYDVANERTEYNNSVSLENHKKAIGHSSYTGSNKNSKGKKSTQETNDDYIKAKNKAENNAQSLLEQARIKLQKNTGAGAALMSEGDIAKLKKGTDDVSKSKYKDYLKALREVTIPHNELLRDANLKAVKAGKIPTNNDVVTASDIESFDKDLEADFAASWLDNTYKILKKTHTSLTKNQVLEAAGKADNSKPLISEIEKYIK